MSKTLPRARVAATNRVGGMRRRGFGRVARALVAGVVAVPAVVGLSATPAAAELTPSRTCANFVTGDSVRMLSICARGYISSAPGLTSGVVETHTFKWQQEPGWVDSRSQSISVNDAILYGAHANTYGFGTTYGQGTCLINSYKGPRGCGVPNATRVAYYSDLSPRSLSGILNATQVLTVSWRDDRGIAHYVRSGWPTSPDRLPILFEWR